MLATGMSAPSAFDQQGEHKVWNENSPGNLRQVA